MHASDVYASSYDEASGAADCPECPGRVVADGGERRCDECGLLADETGRMKVTSWRKSPQPTFEVGDRLRIREAAKHWYQWRWSIASTGRSRVDVIENGRRRSVPSSWPVSGAVETPGRRFTLERVRRR